MILKNDPYNWALFLLTLIVAPLFLFPSIASTNFFLIIPVLLYFRWRARGDLIPKTPMNLALWLLCIQIFISCLMVPEISQSLPKAAGFLYGLMVFIAMTAFFNSERRLKLGLLGFLLGGFLFSIVGFLGMVWYNEGPFKGLMEKISASIPRMNLRLQGAEQGFNPNPLAGALLLFIPLGIMVLGDRRYSRNERAAKRNGMKVLWAGVVAFEVIILVFTQSYGAWIALLLSCWLIMINRKWKIVSAAVLGALVLVAAFISPDKSQGFSRLDRVFTEKIEQRYIFWNGGMDSVRSHPFQGVGMNFLRLDLKIGEQNSHAHNQLIHTAAELGIPALIAYLAVLLGMGYMCREIQKRHPDGYLRMAARALGTGQLAYFIFGLGDSIPLGAKPSLLFWISFGLITSIFSQLPKLSSTGAGCPG